MKALLAIIVLVTLTGCMTSSVHPVDLFHTDEQYNHVAPNWPPIYTVANEAAAQRLVLAECKTDMIRHTLRGSPYFSKGFNGRTGSMLPVLKAQSYIMVLTRRPVPWWRQGDIVSVLNAGDKLVMHVLQQDEQGEWYTFGAHNTRADPGFIGHETNYCGTVVSIYTWPQ